MCQQTDSSAWLNGLNEIEDKTIVYLFARPLHRAVIIGGKVVSVALLTSFLLAIDVTLVYLVVISRDGIMAILANLPLLVGMTGVLALAAVAYSSLFCLFGVLLRRPMILAIIVGLGWELAVSNMPGAFPRLTLLYYLKSLAGVGPESAGFISNFIASLEPASIVNALSVVSLATVFFFCVSLVVASKKEYRV